MAQPVPSWVVCPEGADVGDWKPDGPLVRVEFVRRSKCRICNTNACKRGPLTLVLYDKAAEQPSLWARMTKEVDTPEAAVSALAEREGITGNVEKNIRLWSKTSDDKDPLAIPGLRRWLPTKTSSTWSGQRWDRSSMAIRTKTE